MAIETMTCRRHPALARWQRGTEVPQGEACNTFLGLFCLCVCPYAPQSFGIRSLLCTWDENIDKNVVRHVQTNPFGHVEVRKCSSISLVGIDVDLEKHRLRELLRHCLVDRCDLLAARQKGGRGGGQDEERKARIICAR